MTATTVRRGATLLLLATLLSGLTLVSVAGPASAHDVLRSTNPKDGTHVETPPAEVVLTFDEPALALGTEVLVTGPSGSVATGPPRLVDNEVRQALAAGPAGAYTVVWRVTSADGHPVSGTFGFTADQASASTTATSAPTATPPPRPPPRRRPRPPVRRWRRPAGFRFYPLPLTGVVVALGALVVGWAVRQRRSGGG